jgi:transcriptional regulator of heat shock response
MGLMITERQEKLLEFLVREYISAGEPVSSLALKKITDLEVCGATIRNDLQELAKQGFITQPHTSAGRVPTEKAYKYLADKIERDREREFDDFIVRQVRYAHQEMERQMQMMQEIMQKLEQDNLFEILNILDKWHRKI